MSEHDNRLETWTGKTIMVFCAHPDDDTMCSGTLAKLTQNGNSVLMVFYTNGNKGSHDLTMTSERLAAIRKEEEEAACKVVGIPPENIIWLGYDDGELEYADKRALAGKVARLIRLYRPDAVFCFDPGRQYEQWHKTDHRTAAFSTVDGARSAAYHLYFPEHLLYEGLQPFAVDDFFYFDSQEPNYEVDISDVVELKILNLSKHTSQFGPGHFRYPLDEATAKAEAEALQARIEAAKGKKHIEKLRRGETAY